MILTLNNPSLSLITSSVLKTATEARKRLLGPFSPTFNIENLLREGLLSVLPDDAHERVNGKIFISVTRVSDGKNVLLSHFDSREELIQALLASSFIPLFSGWKPITVRGVRYIDGCFSDNLPVLDSHTITVSPFKGEFDICPKDDNCSFMQALLCSAFIPGFSGWTPLTFRGVRYVDGGFSDNLPQLDENTITVSPFCGEADICPKDFTAGLVTISLANTSIELSRENLYRFTLILFPPPPEVLNRMCQQGFNDALEFLQRNNLINCTRCLAVHSTFNLDANLIKEGVTLQIDDEEDEYQIHCDDCNVQREEAILDTLPETVGSIFQDAIDKANKGIMNWVFKHKSMKLVSILTLPYIIPFEIILATFLKIMRTSPSFKEIKSFGYQVIQLLKALIRAWLSKPVHAQPPHRHNRHHHNNRFSCELSITRFTGEGEIQKVSGEKENFNFSVDVADAPDLHTHRGALTLETEALNQLALRCAAKSVSHLSSKAASRSVSKNPSRAPSRATSRAVSRAVSRIPSLEDLSVPSEWNVSNHPTDDTFEQILNVTNQHDAVMAYYYMDDNNEMKVTEIFDMTSAEEQQNIETRELDEEALQSHLESFKGPHQRTGS
ncbi:Patanin-like phospholipase domain-containing protein [Armadillidium vulgare]|nr:Patanin-like phospholipase domain-containing protein [Armadillidium vulgare]